MRYQHSFNNWMTPTNITSSPADSSITIKFVNDVGHHCPIELSCDDVRRLISTLQQHVEWIDDDRDGQINFDVFADRFSEAFTRLERDHGFNLVRLLDLRRALPEFTRKQFDNGLNHLRRNKLFTLSSGQSRKEEEREAAILENGSLLMFVSRR